MRYYAEGRNARTLDEIKELLIADRLKEAMQEDMQTWVVQGEINLQLKPREIVRKLKRVGKTSGAQRRVKETGCQSSWMLQ